MVKLQDGGCSRSIHVCNGLFEGKYLVWQSRLCCSTCTIEAYFWNTGYNCDFYCVISCVSYSLLCWNLRSTGIIPYTISHCWHTCRAKSAICMPSLVKKQDPKWVGLHATCMFLSISIMDPIHCIVWCWWCCKWIQILCELLMITSSHDVLSSHLLRAELYWPDGRTIKTSPGDQLHTSLY
jgi:hypothetical protein